MIYAQLFEAKVIGISTLAGEVDAPHMIPIEGEPPALGSTWDGNAFTPPPPPTPVPRPLTQLEFIRLLQTVGGVTNAELVAADADPDLAAWWIMFRLAQDIRLDDPKIVEGLLGLVALGYLTEPERQAVIDEWPKA